MLASAFVASALPPVVSAVNPASGPPTTVVTVSGSNFDSSLANVSVSFGGVPATVVSASQTQITAIVPFGAVSGPVTVTVFGQQVDWSGLHRDRSETQHQSGRNSVSVCGHLLRFRRHTGGLSEQQ